MSWLPLFSPQDILEGGNLWNALQELQQIITTPIKAFHALQAAAASKEALPLAAEPRGGPKLALEKSSNSTEDKEANDDPFPPPTGSPCDGESGAAPIAEGDVAGQFTRVMGKGELSGAGGCVSPSHQDKLG